MEPTTIKTKTTKPLHELPRAEHRATIDIGGVTHNIRRRVDGFSLQCPRVDGESGCLTGGTSPKALSPDAEVTVTEERPMTDSDLRVGDCYRKPGMACYVAFVIELGNGRCLRVDRDGSVSQANKAGSPQPTTLVTPKFDAEPVQEGEVMEVSRVGEQNWFFLEGRKGKFNGLSCGWARVRWSGVIERTADLPPTTPVTVHTDATYDSWDDVSVGDVFMREGGVACIKLSKNEWYEGGAGGGVRQANRRPIIGREFGRSVKPARLTSVSWERIPEVER